MEVVVKWLMESGAPIGVVVAVAGWSLTMIELRKANAFNRELVGRLLNGLLGEEEDG